MILKIKGNKIWFSAISMLVIVAVITTVIRIASPTQKLPNIKNNNPFFDMFNSSSSLIFTVIIYTPLLSRSDIGRHEVTKLPREAGRDF